MELTAPESSLASQGTTGPCGNAMEPGCPEADNGKSLSAARPGALPYKVPGKSSLSCASRKAEKCAMGSSIGEGGQGAVAGVEGAGSSSGFN
eukprot:1825780-Pleurochrysis_carterae.AAC.1